MYQIKNKIFNLIINLYIINSFINKINTMIFFLPLFFHMKLESGPTIQLSC